MGFDNLVAASKEWARVLALAERTATMAWRAL
jgi:hypothetical protein